MDKPQLQEHDLKFDPEALDKRLRSDEPFFSQSCFRVQDRDSQRIVPLQFKRAQHYYDEKRQAFNIILKGRKLGISTRIIARTLWRCSMQPNRHAILIAQNGDEAAKFLEERVRPMVQACQYPLQAVTRAWGYWFPRTNSRYYVGAAGAKKFGRGSDITDYHLTEKAWWEKPDIITGIEEGCLEGAEGDIESTANGTNHFHQDWRRAKAGQGRYSHMFLGWWLDERYRIKGGVIKGGPTEYEQGLQKALGLDQEQIAWLRWKESQMSQPELRPQEFPSYPEEAFLSSGRAVFDWTALVDHEGRCGAPRWRGTLQDRGDYIELQPQPEGPLRLWENPMDRHEYVIGADVAEGIEGGAYSAACVVDAGNGKQVAEWHGHCDPDTFGLILTRLGLFYNRALVAPESWPGPGGITTAKMVSLGYSNIWSRPASPGSKRGSDQLLGWATDSRTRLDLLLTFTYEAVRDFGLVIKSVDLVNECRNLVYDDSGSPEPHEGTFVDRVFAAAIAWKVSREIATGLNYDERPSLRRLFGKLSSRGRGPASPQWRGRRYGVA